jgi:hypothetical protein
MQGEFSARPLNFIQNTLGWGSAGEEDPTD